MISHLTPKIGTKTPGFVSQSWDADSGEPRNVSDSPVKVGTKTPAFTPRGWADGDTEAK